MGTVIAVTLPKGGVGKTTTAVNLAAGLSLAGKHTLLVDADAFGASAIALGITGEKIRAGLFDVFNCTHGLQSVIHHTELPFLDLIPSNVRSIPMEERLLQMAENRTILKQSLRDVKNVYDYIIIDTPPYLRGMTTNALVAADSVIIPVRSGHFSIDAVEKLMSFIEWMRKIANPSLKVEGVLLTMHESRTKATVLTVGELERQFGSYLFKSIIPKNSLLAESTFYGKPVAVVNKHSPGALAYTSLTQEIIFRSEAAQSNQTGEQAQSA
jgi:chromosome partitioning protein